MTSDSELLRRYADAGDEAAFAEIVRRHVDLVYSAALRMTGGDAPSSQDAAQEVFTLLARRAPTLATHPRIVGWIYTTTRHCVRNHARTERRRRFHEQHACAMQDTATPPEIQWESLRPVLDEAVCQLGAADREAVLLRFFQNKSHREVGDALGLKEDAARKRVDRALEKLRSHFAHRGVTVSGAALAGSLTANSVQAAPVALAGNITHASLANSGGAAIEGIFIKLLFMSTKTKLLVVVVIMVILAFFAIRWRQPRQFTAERLSPSAASSNTVNLPVSPSVTAPSIGAAVSPPVNSIAKPAIASGRASAEIVADPVRIAIEPANGSEAVRLAMEAYEAKATPTQYPLGDISVLHILPLFPKYILQWADLIKGSGMEAAHEEGFIYTVNKTAAVTSAATITADVHLNGAGVATDAQLSVEAYGGPLYGWALRQMNTNEQVMKGSYELRYLLVNDAQGHRLATAYWLRADAGGGDLVFPINERASSSIKNRHVYTTAEYLDLVRKK